MKAMNKVTFSGEVIDDINRQLGEIKQAIIQLAGAVRGDAVSDEPGSSRMGHKELRRMVREPMASVGRNTSSDKSYGLLSKPVPQEE